MKTRLISIDTPVLEGKAQLSDFIADPASVSPEEAVLREDMTTELKVLLEVLDPREKNVLVKRFGIGGEDERSLRDLSREFGVTAERIRQIEKKAMDKMGAVWRPWRATMFLLSNQSSQTDIPALSSALPPVPPFFRGTSSPPLPD